MHHRRSAVVLQDVMGLLPQPGRVPELHGDLPRGRPRHGAQVLQESVQAFRVLLEAGRELDERGAAFRAFKRSHRVEEPAHVRASFSFLQWVTPRHIFAANRNDDGTSSIHEDTVAGLGRPWNVPLTSTVGNLEPRCSSHRRLGRPSG